MKLIKLSQFQEKYFDKKSFPAKSTLIKQIEANLLKGIKFSNQYYVDDDQFMQSSIADLLEK